MYQPIQLARFSLAEFERGLEGLTDADGQRRVKVSVTYPFKTLVSWPFIPSQMNIQRATEMRVIR